MITDDAVVFAIARGGDACSVYEAPTVEEARARAAGSGKRWAEGRVILAREWLDGSVLVVTPKGAEHGKTTRTAWIGPIVAQMLDSG